MHADGMRVNEQSGLSSAARGPTALPTEILVANHGLGLLTADLSPSA
jgi:hypothetical protein